MVKFLYTTMADVIALAYVTNPTRFPVFGDGSPLPKLVNSMLLVRLPKHETYANTDEGLNLLYVWSNLYAVKMLTTLAPHIFTQSSTFEGDTVTKRAFDFQAFVAELNENLKAVESTLLAMASAAAGEATYGLIGKASPAYNPITGA